MEIQDWYSSRFLNETYREIRRNGLEANLAELEAFGFTMIEHELTADEVERTKSLILQVAERRLGYPIDLNATANLHGKLPGTPVLTGLLFEDTWFEELLLRNKPLLLITYLMGKSGKLNSVSSHIKAGGADGLRLHVDAANGITTPLPFYSTFANLTYALTDYSREGGALAMVPGSHRWCRQPSPIEAVMSLGKESPLAVPLTPKAGTAIIWHGNTWHGAFPRQLAGVRMNLIFAFCRQFIDTQEAIKGRVPAEAWERHDGDERFAALMGKFNYHGWEKDEDFVQDYTERAAQAGTDWHA